MDKTSIHPLMNPTSSSLFIGSCFSEHLSKKMREEGLSVNANPLGVLFNPISLADMFIVSKEVMEESVFMREDVALSWMANSTFFSYDKEALIQTLKQKIVALREAVKSLDFLFITFGTAYVYRYTESQKIVANCHKIKQSNFDKELLTIPEITKFWTEALSQIFVNNPKVQVVFTVSPVRHLRDGWIENARSKAILLEAVHQLIDNHDNCTYFPSYEIVVDELRDYVFYNEDGVHPNKKAIDVVWNRFKTFFFSEETARMNKDLLKVKQLFNHHSLHSKSRAAQAFNEKREKEWERLRKEYPWLIKGDVLTKNPK